MPAMKFELPGFYFMDNFWVEMPMKFTCDARRDIFDDVYGHFEFTIPDVLDYLKLSCDDKRCIEEWGMRRVEMHPHGSIEVHEANKVGRRGSICLGGFQPHFDRAVVKGDKDRAIAVMTMALNRNDHLAIPNYIKVSRVKKDNVLKPCTKKALSHYMRYTYAGGIINGLKYCPKCRTFWDANATLNCPDYEGVHT